MCMFKYKPGFFYWGGGGGGCLHVYVTLLYIGFVLVHVYVHVHVYVFFKRVFIFKTGFIGYGVACTCIITQA